MPTLIPAWPAILTNADWQKKKGLIAKIAGETGIGDAMTKAEAEYKKINWDTIETTQITQQDREPPIVEARKKAAIDYVSGFMQEVRAKIKVLVDKADATLKAWQKNKLIPKASKDHVEKIKQEAEMLWYLLKSNSEAITERLKTFDDLLQSLQMRYEVALRDIDGNIANLEKALVECAKNPSIASWSEGQTCPHQRCRSMNNCIRQVPQWKAKYFATWQKFGDFYHKDAPQGGPAEKQAIVEKIKTVATELKKFKSDYKSLLQT